MNEAKNLCMFSGKLGRDSELRFTSTGKARLTFSVAVNEYAGKGDNGRTKFDTTWVNMVLWGARAETAKDMLTKGVEVRVVCQYSNRSYEKDGAKQYVHEFRVLDFDVVRISGGSGSRRGNGGTQEDNDNFDYQGSGYDEEDMPF